MSVLSINFNNVIAYSKRFCTLKSRSKCATFVKKAFEAGGCKYISGNGWCNQQWCKDNGFQLIGDFVPDMKNPRSPIKVETEDICNVNGLQFPRMADGNPYKQQAGDVCLIKHGIYGHICYAMSDNINDWVSDFFQKSPGQLDGMGPYCYTGNIERVQFWRHVSVMNGAPVITEKIETPYYTPMEYSTSSYSSNNTTSYGANRVKMLSSVNKRHNEDAYKQDEERKNQFSALQQKLSSEAPEMGRDIYLTEEMYDSNILKGNQQSTEDWS